jgi:hypothetical protein
VNYEKCDMATCDFNREFVEHFNLIQTLINIPPINRSSAFLYFHGKEQMKCFWYFTFVMLEKAICKKIAINKK